MIDKPLVRVALRHKAIYLDVERNGIDMNSSVSVSVMAFTEPLRENGFCVSEKLLHDLNAVSTDKLSQITKCINSVMGTNLNWASLLKGWDVSSCETRADHLVTFLANILGEECGFKGTTLPCGHLIPEGAFPLERYNGCSFCGTAFKTADFVYKGQGSKLKELQLFTDKDMTDVLVSLLTSATPLDETQKILKSPSDVLRYLWYEKTGFVQIIEPKTLIAHASRLNGDMWGAWKMFAWSSNRKAMDAESKRLMKSKLMLKYDRKASLRVAKWLNNLPMSTHAAFDYPYKTVPRNPVSSGNTSKIPRGIVDDIHYAMGSKEGRKKEDAKKRLITMIEGWFDTPSSGYSKKVLTGAVDNTKSEALEEDIYTRHPSSQVPNISVEIKKITVLNRKDGSKRENYGFVYNIDGENVEMYIGGTEPAMIYACTLLKQYTGARFYLDDLKIRKGELSKFNPNTSEQKYQNATLEWIKQIYKVFVPSAEKDFAEWYASLFNLQDKSPGHPIYQGKSACNSKISKTLKEHRKAIYFCTLQAREDSKGKFYEVDLPSSESIKLSKELLKLVPESPVTPAHARPENKYHK